MNTVIEIFNQLTHTELADCNTFENIIVNHYNKFRMLYKYLKYVDMNEISKITCVDSSSGLVVCICYKDSYALYNLIVNLDNEFNFDIETEHVDNKLVLKIFDREMSEVDIDESRFGFNKRSNRHK